MLQQHQENPVWLLLQPHWLAATAQFSGPGTEFELAKPKNACAPHGSGGHDAIPPSLVGRRDRWKVARLIRDQTVIHG
jgi:hypothetical protein